MQLNDDVFNQQMNSASLCIIIYVSLSLIILQSNNLIYCHDDEYKHFHCYYLLWERSRDVNKLALVEVGIVTIVDTLQLTCI